VTGQACALLAGGIGAATLSQHVFGWDLGIDQLLFADGIGLDSLETAELSAVLEPEFPSAADLASAVTRNAVEMLEPHPLYLRRPDATPPSRRKSVLTYASAPAGRKQP
jgi:hypothetical protein